MQQASSEWWDLTSLPTCKVFTAILVPLKLSEMYLGIVYCLDSIFTTLGTYGTVVKCLLKLCVFK